MLATVFKAGKPKALVLNILAAIKIPQNKSLFTLKKHFKTEHIPSSES